MTGRQARQLVASLQARIGPWQRRLAFLRTMKMHDREDPNAYGEVDELVSLTIAAGIELEGLVDDLDAPAIAAHSVIVGMRASLIRLRTELEQLDGAGARTRD